MIKTWSFVRWGLCDSVQVNVRVRWLLFCFVFLRFGRGKRGNFGGLWRLFLSSLRPIYITSYQLLMLVILDVVMEGGMTCEHPRICLTGVRCLFCVVDFPDVGRSRRRWLPAESLILNFCILGVVLFFLIFR